MLLQFVLNYLSVLLVFEIPLSAYSFSVGTAVWGRQSSPVSVSSLAMSTNPLLQADELEAILEVAKAASKKAGDIILGNAGGAEVTKTKFNSKDLLTLFRSALREDNQGDSGGIFSSS